MTGIEIAAGIAAAAAVVGAAGAISQGQAQKKAAEANARIAEQQAEAVRARARFEEDRQRELRGRAIGAQRAAAAASGIVLDAEGSALLAQSETVIESELDILAIRFASSIEEQRAISAAALSRFEGRALQRQSFFTAGSSLLKGAGSISRILR